MPGIGSLLHPDLLPIQRRQIRPAAMVAKAVFQLVPLPALTGSTYHTPSGADSTSSAPISQASSSARSVPSMSSQSVIRRRRNGRASQAVDGRRRCGQVLAGIDGRGGVPQVKVLGAGVDRNELIYRFEESHGAIPCSGPVRGDVVRLRAAADGEVFTVAHGNGVHGRNEAVPLVHPFSVHAENGAVFDGGLGGLPAGDDTGRAAVVDDAVAGYEIAVHAALDAEAFAVAHIEIVNYQPLQDDPLRIPDGHRRRHKAVPEIFQLQPVHARVIVLDEDPAAGAVQTVQDHARCRLRPCAAPSQPP